MGAEKTSRLDVEHSRDQIRCLKAEVVDRKSSVTINSLPFPGQSYLLEKDFLFFSEDSLSGM